MTEKYYLSKYALTKGIQEVELQNNKSDSAYVWVKGQNYMSYRLGTEIHTSLDEAVKKAEEMRQKKIESHEKSIAKLKKMTFGQ